ncbi:hypothetical protein KCP73_08355 [Salmonella enterica subsp. enterica]|nr:hypothetical protein KCP73_08355 [Salmonella enterica subsp. enterica]
MAPSFNHNLVNTGIGLPPPQTHRVMTAGSDGGHKAWPIALHRAERRYQSPPTEGAGVIVTRASMATRNQLVDAGVAHYPRDFGAPARDRFRSWL